MNINHTAVKTINAIMQLNTLVQITIVLFFPVGEGGLVVLGIVGKVNGAEEGETVSINLTFKSEIDSKVSSIKRNVSI